MADNRLILTFDSGLGGLTVYREIRALLPQTGSVYLADDAAFPYGRLTEDAVINRVQIVIAAALAHISPDVVVIACNTASTVVLPHLREKYPLVEFVGTVPAVKPAAEQSLSGMITVLGTSGTVQRDYTRALIRDHAAHCDVTLVGSEDLAGLAEKIMHQPDALASGAFDAKLADELRPCFVEGQGRRTDRIVLACTHYPLLRDRFNLLAGTRVGWPVEFIDPAPAIARRVAFVLEQRPKREEGLAEITPQVWTTSGQADSAARALFASYGLEFDSSFSCAFDR